MGAKRKPLEEMTLAELVADQQREANDKRPARVRIGRSDAIFLGGDPDGTLKFLRSKPPPCPAGPSLALDGRLEDAGKTLRVDQIPDRPSDSRAKSADHGATTFFAETPEQQEAERLLLEPPGGASREAPGPIEEAQECLRVRHLVEQLTPKEYDAIVRLFYFDETERQAAASLGISRASLRGRRDAALTKLGAWLTAEGLGGVDRVKSATPDREIVPALPAQRGVHIETTTPMSKRRRPRRKPQSSPVTVRST